MSRQQGSVVRLQEQVEKASSRDALCITESGVPCADFDLCISTSNCLSVGLIRDTLLEASVAKNARCPLNPALPFHSESRLTLHRGVAVCLVLTNRTCMKMTCASQAVTFKTQVSHFSMVFLSLAQQDAGDGDCSRRWPRPKRDGFWATARKKAAAVPPWAAG